MFRYLVFGLISFGLGSLAFADDLSDAIQAYNAAQQGGDRATRISTARDLGTAALTAPERDDTSVLIFEAAKTLIIQGSALDAKEMAAWLEAAEIDENSQIDPIDTNIVIEYVRWAEDPSKSNRQALDDALEIVEPLAPNLLSLMVFQERYVADLEKGNGRALVTSAKAAATHLEPAKTAVGELWSNAVIMSHSAAFNWSTSKESLFDMARHEVALRQLHADMHAEMNEGSVEHPEWINKHMALSETWRLAMDAYFDSDASENRSQRTRRIEEVENILDWESPVRMVHSGEEDLSEALPFCGGEFDMKPKMEYPRRAERQGRVGAVMLSIDVKDGRVSEVEVLAAIPNEGFTDAIIRTVNKWTWMVDEDAVERPCSMDAEGIRLPFTFYFGD